MIKVTREVRVWQAQLRGNEADSRRSDDDARRLSQALAAKEAECAGALEQLDVQRAEHAQLLEAYQNTAQQLKLVEPQAHGTRALEALVAELSQKKEELEEELRKVMASMSTEQQAHLGSHAMLRSQVPCEAASSALSSLSLPPRLWVERTGRL